LTAAAWSQVGGLATLGHDATVLLRDLDELVLEWATIDTATEVTYPPLLAASALDRIDYFRNFPHLGSVATRISPDRVGEYVRRTRVGEIPAADLADAEYLLPSATCYSVYLDLEDTELQSPLRTTAVTRCFRTEDHYDGLRRLWGFTMREVVCVGDTTSVRDHLSSYTKRIDWLCGQLGLAVTIENATDPFFSKNDPRALLQLLEPVKREFRINDGTAIASLNYHRNFFGDKLNIGYRDKPAFTGCAAFGLERWLYALDAAWAGDLVAAREAVVAARKGAC
jgi:seryl-tRNA synthetase